jgi:hypothetical protein
MTAETDMSRPSKRFVLPYEPEYTAHRTDWRTKRAMQLHRLARRQHVMRPGLAPNAPAGKSVVGNGSTRQARARARQRHGFPDKS